MTIEYKDGRFFIAQWFLPGRGMDYLAVAYTDEPEGEDARIWTVQYRFRYYTSGSLDPNASDEKSWYTMRTTDRSAADVEDLVDKTVATLLVTGFAPRGTEMSKLRLMSADVDRNVDALLKQPYNHVVTTGRGGDA